MTELENVINDVNELKNLTKILKQNIVSAHKHSCKKINSLELWVANEIK